MSAATMAIRVNIATVAAGAFAAPRRRNLRTTSRGFSLVELMVALVLAGIILLGLAVFFVSSSRSFAEAERVSRQIENGRYAASLLAEEIRHAGFYGEVANVLNLPPTSAIAVPASIPTVCDTNVTIVRNALPVPIQGVDAPDAVPTCVPDAVANTDVLVVRRANTTTIAAGSAVASGYYTQTGNCLTQTPIFKLDQTGFTLHDKDCTTVMPIRQYHVIIYYIAPCSVATGSSGECLSADKALPTLKRVELTPGAMSQPEPLVEGIENMQLEYGLDTNGDGTADSYTAKPTTVAQWMQVVSVRVHLLARNTDASPDFTDTKTYNLGKKSDGTANTVTPGGNFRRHAYTEVVRVNNISQRIEASFP